MRVRSVAGPSWVFLFVGPIACNAAAVDPGAWDREGSPAQAVSSSSGEPDPDANLDPDVDAGAGSSSGATPVAGSCLTLQLATKTYGGEYGPDHVGAIWIETEAGEFVRSLEVWGTRRLEHAVAWREASGGNVVDAITGATRKVHGPHAVRWDCLDATGATPPAGPMVAHVEFTEEDSNEGAPRGPHRMLPFDTSAPASLAEADDATFRSISGTSAAP